MIRSNKPCAAAPAATAKSKEGGRESTIQRAGLEVIGNFSILATYSSRTNIVARLDQCA